ncbi:MAG: hypothetical protein KGJ55_06725 [Gammaproteobacteria bacterium]|nr:hypothetical protein [Gammaproteobacteria bacterium]
MKQRRYRPGVLWFLASALVLIAPPALAYVGPGAGLSLLGTLWGLLAAVVAAVGYVLLWPFRSVLRRRRRARSQADAGLADRREARPPAPTGRQPETD